MALHLRERKRDRVKERERRIESVMDRREGDRKKERVCDNRREGRRGSAGLTPGGFSLHLCGVNKQSKAAVSLPSPSPA